MHEEDTLQDAGRQRLRATDHNAERRLRGDVAEEGGRHLGESAPRRDGRLLDDARRAALPYGPGRPRGETAPRVVHLQDHSNAQPRRRHQRQLQVLTRRM